MVCVGFDFDGGHSLDQQKPYTRVHHPTNPQIEEVQSTTKTQRVAVHTHVKVRRKKQRTLWLVGC